MQSAQNTTDRANLWQSLQAHYDKDIKNSHLRELLKDEKRNAALRVEHENIYYDFSHERLTEETLNQFDKLVQDSHLFDRIEAMFRGDKINSTEKRAVLHVALRSKEDEVFNVDNKNVVPEVHEILKRVSEFAENVRNGKVTGYTNKPLTNLIVIGIGGSYLGIEFVYEAIRLHNDCVKSSSGRTIRFLANVDPNDFARATQGLDPEQTLIMVNSKTFTTAETMLNARTAKDWLLKHYRNNNIAFSDEKDVTNRHLCAVSTALKETRAFGISDEKVFGFWDWVGGRYSVSSAIGVLPLSLHFGYDIVRQFLDGANYIDRHFRTTKDIRKNIPLLLGLIGFYNTTILNLESRAILPYSQALSKFAPHVQQLVMESNGKGVTIDGKFLNYAATGIHFGEPGTNGQHSFYQLLHQGRVVPAEFIGFCKSQTPVDLAGEPVSNQDELMSNFFSQPDALAFGKTIEELKAESVPEELLNHKFFPGNRPSSQFLFNQLDAFTVGQILAIYEHRTVVEGFLWDVNSFDQWGVELGKALAKQVRGFLNKNREQVAEPKYEGFNFNTSTSSQLKRYCANK